MSVIPSDLLKSKIGGLARREETSAIVVRTNQGLSVQTTARNWDKRKGARKLRREAGCHLLIDRNGKVYRYADEKARLRVVKGTLSERAVGVMLASMGHLPGRGDRPKTLLKMGRWTLGRIPPFRGGRETRAKVRRYFGPWALMVRLRAARCPRGRGALPATWEVFPDEQLDSLVASLRRLCVQFGLPRNFLPNAWASFRSLNVRWIESSGGRYGRWFVERFGRKRLLELEKKKRVVLDGKPQRGRDAVVRLFLKLFEGILGHQTVHPRLRDPGPMLDWSRVQRGVRNDWWFPFDLGNEERDYRGALSFWDYGAASMTDAYLQLVEGAGGGTFPVGSNGLWHGGIHAVFARPTPVYAMANGRVVACRYGEAAEPDANRGSPFFVLLEHELHLEADAQGRLDASKPGTKVYSLYMHLVPAGFSFEKPARRRGGKPPANPGWLDALLERRDELREEIAILEAAGAAHLEAANKALPDKLLRPLDALQKELEELEALLEKLQAGEIVFPGLRVCVGDKLGVVGAYAHRRTLHVGVFSATKIEGPFNIDVGSAEYVDEAAVKKALNADPASADMPRQAVRLRRARAHFPSEWALRREDLGELVDDEDFARCAPLMFWEAVAKGVPDFPQSRTVYHYHPFTFLGWVNELQRTDEDSRYLHAFNDRDPKVVALEKVLKELAPKPPKVKQKAAKPA